MEPRDSLSFEQIALSPQGACQVGEALIQSGDLDSVGALLRAVGGKLLPTERGENPWDGAAGTFWMSALRSGKTEWIRDVFSSMASADKESKDRARQAARLLLLASAKAKAFDTFDYLLSLGAARRSWKILRSAYQHGGWECAARVKNPTPNEVDQLRRLGLFDANASKWDHDSKGEHTLEGLLWLSKFREEGVGDPLDARWLAGIAFGQTDELAAACIAERDALGLHLAIDSDPYAGAMALAGVGADKTFQAYIDATGVDPSGPASSEVSSRTYEIWVPPTGGATHSLALKFHHKTCCVIPALFSGSETLAARLFEQMKVKPGREQIDFILHNANGWEIDRLKGPVAQAAALLEKLEIFGAAPTAAKAAPRRNLAL